MNEFMKKRSTEGLNQVQLKSANAFNDFIDKLIKRGYILTEPYKLGNEKVKLICPKGHEYFVTPVSFRLGRRCSRCSNMSPEQAKERFIKLLEETKYKLLSEYIFCNREVILQCPRGHEFEVIPQEFKQGRRCPYCNTRSYGESLARDILEEHNIEFIRQYNYEKLNGLGGNVLRFDFYIPSINTLIEIQGEGHFEEYKGNYFNDTTIEHDKLKRKFCKQNNIRLIEIPYLSTVYGREEALGKVKNRVEEIIKEIKI